MAMKTVWFWKGLPLNSKWAMVANYSTDEYPHPSTINSDICPTQEEPLSICSIDEHNNLVVELLDEQFSASPDLWYVLEENSFPTEMITLHAMSCGSFPKGTVVTVNDIRHLGLKPPDRAGFLKWFREDSRIQQIFVSENSRRMRISTTLFGVADIVIISGAYGRYLNGGDVTTPDGEKLREAWGSSSRVTPRIGSVDKYVDNNE